ncbi:MAG: helix-turn-helix domain-containing protein [Candidatus Binatia bacterium]|jgi:hypothetical protein
MELIDARHAAKILAVSVARVYELARTHMLPDGVVVHLGRQIRINSEGLEDWIKGGGQALAGGWRREAEQHELPPAMTLSPRRRRAG